MAVAYVDWRKVEAARLGAIYAAEIRRWSDRLGWDTASSWDHIELGRRLGTVSGLCALDARGDIVGLTFYLLHGDVLQVGGFTAATEDITMALLDGILASDSARRARSVTLFAFTDAPGLARALSRRGLTVVGYDYMVRPLVVEAGGPWDCLRPWRADEAAAVAKLLAAAYPVADRGRPFAPGGTAREWDEYVGQILNAAGCGAIMPEACLVAASGSGSITGVILVTRLAAATGHVAQIAVDPAAERRGAGRLLLDAACATARKMGCDQMTLLVDERNVRARGLYQRAGFRAVAGFTSAGSDQPVRLTSVAAGGMAVTRL